MTTPSPADGLRECLAQEIRRVDGNHTLGAAALADALMPFLTAHLATALRLREGWRPIESAPKDGSLFLGWVAAERWSAMDGGGSGRSADTSEVDFCQWRNMATGGFYENMMGQIGDAQDITHWMPLPAPPTADDLARVLEETK